MKPQVTFQWIDPCPNERLARAQECLRESVVARGLEPLLFPAGPGLVKFSEVLGFARKHARGRSFVWCNSDVTLIRNPYELEDGQMVRGFHRREVPSGDLCGGVDMYLIPNAVWDGILSRDLPDLWCGATHVDWWLTRAAALAGRYTSHFGSIDHVTHPESPASKGGGNRFYRHNIREYNKWARRNHAGRFEQRIRLPLVGESLSPLTDVFRLLKKSS
ncbi:MAG: hypothetical protein IAE94_13830 [Chthoniobacterales bacterium]|nr:hypothetical protein [Chthoniobacterales bacterium]